MKCTKIFNKLDPYLIRICEYFIFPTSVNCSKIYKLHENKIPSILYNEKQFFSPNWIYTIFTTYSPKIQIFSTLWFVYFYDILHLLCLSTTVTDKINQLQLAALIFGHSSLSCLFGLLDVRRFCWLRLAESCKDEWLIYYNLLRKIYINFDTNQ